MAIVATIVAAVSVIATSKYYEGINTIQPVAVVTPKLTSSAAPTPLTATPTPNFTADWQIYTNDKYGYEVKYPENYSALAGDVSEKIALFKSAKMEILQTATFIDSKIAASYIGLNSSDDKIVKIIIYNNGNNYALKQWLKK